MSRPDVALVGAYPAAGERAEGVPDIPGYTANLARALAATGARVTVVAPREAGQPQRAADGAVRVERRFARGGTRALSDALAAAQATGARVVHLQHGRGASLPGLLWALRRAAADHVRTVVTLHDVLDPAAPALPGLARGGVLRNAIAALQATVGRLADAVVVHEGPSAERVPGAVVIPHGVDRLAPVNRYASRALLGLDDRPAVLCFGTLAPHRGLEVALEAFERTRGAVSLVLADAGHARLKAAGDTDASSLLDGLAFTPVVHGDAQRFTGAVRFVGRLPAGEVGAWFGAADLALFPSPRACPSSATIALALAHGTPFLVSPPAAAALGAPALAMADDPAALAGSLAWLVDEPSRVAALRRAVGALAADRSWPVIADRHLALYTRLATATQTDAAGSFRLQAA